MVIKVFLSIAVFLGGCGSAAGQELPASILKYLNTNYPGWRAVGTTSEFCSKEYRKAVGVGDFNGDRRRDYAVKFTHSTRGYIIAFVVRKTKVEPHILMRLKASEVREWALRVSPRGQLSPIGRLTNSAVMTGPCASEVIFYIYRNGEFKEY